MTRKIAISLLLGVLGVGALVSVYSQSRTNLFRDKQGRFTVEVPPGWTAEVLNEDTVQIAAPPAYVTILTLQTTANAQDICSQLTAQIHSQWQGLQVVREGQITISGRPAYAVVFTGTNPRGVFSALRIVGISLGSRGYALMFSVPGEQFNAVKSALDEIEHSFAVTGIAGGTTSAGGGPASAPSQRLTQPLSQVPRGGIPAFLLKGGFCTALAPADWKVTGVLPDGKGFSMRNADFVGAYVIMAFTALSVQMQPARYANPHVYVQGMIADNSVQSGYGPVLQMAQLQQYGDMFVQEGETASRHIVAMYSVYPMSMGGYVLVYRRADGPRELWQEYGTIAILAAGSIRCQAQYTPSSAGSSGRTSREPSRQSTYNIQLGTEYAHDPETGETFFMKHASDWRETGPDGPGYYRQVGNGYRKLVPGLLE
jgi:hypothetical protein